MPVAAIVPQFPRPSSPTTPVQRSVRVEAAKAKFYEQCVDRPKELYDQAGCAYAFDQWRKADKSWKHELSQIAATHLPAWLVQLQQPEPAQPVPTAGPRVLPSTPRTEVRRVPS